MAKFKIPKKRVINGLILILLVITGIWLLNRPRVLLVGFEPYGGAKVNSSQVAIETWDHLTWLKPFWKASYQTLILPVDYDKASKILALIIQKEKPKTILMFGVHYETDAVRLEQVARGVKGKRLPTNLKLKKARDELQKQGVKAALSNHAGFYICNNLYYFVRNEYSKQKGEAIKVGFIHLPQVNTHGFTKEKLVSVIDISINTLP